MADLIFSRSRQQMMGSGFAGLLGLFAGLCAIFAVFITLSDWHQETTQARWPVVSAVVDRADRLSARAKARWRNGKEASLSRAVRTERRSADGNADVARGIFRNGSSKAAILGGAASQGQSALLFSISAPSRCGSANVGERSDGRQALVPLLSRKEMVGSLRLPQSH